MATAPGADGRAALLRKMARHSRRGDSTTSSFTSQASVSDKSDSLFWDPENEAIESSPGPFGCGRHSMTPAAQFGLNPNAFQPARPELTEDRSSFRSEDTLEMGRGGNKLFSIMEDSRNNSLQSGNPKVLSTPPLFVGKQRKGHNSVVSPQTAHTQPADTAFEKENYDPIAETVPNKGNQQRVSKHDRKTLAAIHEKARDYYEQPSVVDERRQAVSRKTLAEMHEMARAYYEKSPVLEERPPEMTFTAKNTRFGGGNYAKTKKSGLNAAHEEDYPTRSNATNNLPLETNQSYVLPDLPDLSELVSGTYGTPGLQRTINKSRFQPAKDNKVSRPFASQDVEAVPMPDDEKAIFTSLRVLQDKMGYLEDANVDAQRKFAGAREERDELLRQKQEQAYYGVKDSAFETGVEDPEVDRQKRRAARHEAREARRAAQAPRRVSEGTRALNDRIQEIKTKLDPLYIPPSPPSPRKLRKEREELQAENAALKQENAVLREQLAKISAYLGTAQNNADDETRLSYMDAGHLASLRKTLEEERLTGKSTMKYTAEGPFNDLIPEATVTASSGISNTSRPRHRAATTNEAMTSAFIVPDLTFGGPEKQDGGVRESSKEVVHTSDPHDGHNCAVCQRIWEEAKMSSPAKAELAGKKKSVSVRRPVPASSRVDLGEDHTIRPSQAPSIALALSIKKLEDELNGLKIKLSKQQTRYNNSNPSISRRERLQCGKKIETLLQACEHKADLIYSLYDVLEGQKATGTEMTQEEVEVTVTDMKSVGGKKLEAKKVGKPVPRAFSDLEDDSEFDEDMDNGTDSLFHIGDAEWRGFTGTH